MDGEWTKLTWGAVELHTTAFGPLEVELGLHPAERPGKGGKRAKVWRLNFTFPDDGAEMTAAGLEAAKAEALAFVREQLAAALAALHLPAAAGKGGRDGA
jgi:hypothetical protein